MWSEPDDKQQQRTVDGANMDFDVLYSGPAGPKGPVGPPGPSGQNVR